MVIKIKLDANKAEASATETFALSKINKLNRDNPATYGAVKVWNNCER